MPTRLAARKWPSSCTNTSTPSTNANASRVVIRLVQRPQTSSILPRGQSPAEYSRAQRPPRALPRASRPRPATCASIVRSMTCGIAVNPMRPSRNAPPPPRWRRSAPPAGCARPRARDRRAAGRETPRVSGTSKSSRPARARSSDGSGAAQRSGYENAYWIGSRMSVTPSCAMIDPSTSSTIECTIDCGWMTTSIWSAPDAEQPVRLDDLEPLVHQRRRVDRDLAAHPPRRMLQRVLGGHVRELADVRPRNGPPDAVSTRRRTSEASRPCRHW